MLWPTALIFLSVSLQGSFSSPQYRNYYFHLVDEKTEALSG